MSDRNIQADLRKRRSHRRAIEDAHLPSLIAAAAHISGDLALLRTGAIPVYDIFGDGQGGFTPEKDRTNSARRFSRSSRPIASGGTLAPAPDAKTLREMMEFVAGAEIPGALRPYLEEEMEFGGGDSARRIGARRCRDAAKKKFKVLIVGAGMSGMLSAIRLKQAGMPFEIVEKKDVGGTWLENTYPGCRVDNPNHMYSFSFEPNHKWPQHYSTQPVLSIYFRARRREIRHA